MRKPNDAREDAIAAMLARVDMAAVDLAVGEAADLEQTEVELVLTDDQVALLRMIGYTCRDVFVGGSPSKVRVGF